MRRRPNIPPRTPIFIGCEGDSEVGYAALLNRLAREANLHIHIRAEVLQPGAGDPLALVQKAIQTIAHIQRNREAFLHKAVLIDLGANAQKVAQALQLAARSGISVIGQDPDHEALLLRHLEGCHTLRPPRGASMGALLKEWPTYSKPMTQIQLAERIDLVRISQACTVEPNLRAFLVAIGLITGAG